MFDRCAIVKSWAAAAAEGREGSRQPTADGRTTRRGLRGSLYLYTSDLGTTLPPDLGTYTFTYIGFRQNRLRYYMINGTEVHH